MAGACVTVPDKELGDQSFGGDVLHNKNSSFQKDFPTSQVSRVGLVSYWETD